MQNFNVTSTSSGPPERYSGTDRPSFLSNLQSKSMKSNQAHRAAFFSGFSKAILLRFKVCSGLGIISNMILMSTILFALPQMAVGQSSNFSYGFEAVPGANDWSANIAVASGTNGIMAANGSSYGSVPSPASPTNQFTRFGSYNSIWPCNGYKTSIKIYLDVTTGYANDTRLNYSSAVSNQAGAHLRDFIYHVGFYNSSDVTGPGAGTDRFIIGESPNSPGNPKGSPGAFAISSSGWYTFEHSFSNSAGFLSVDYNVYDASNVLVGTINRTTADNINTTVGGNRYGWMVTNAFSPLAVDDITLTVNPGNLPTSSTDFESFANGTVNYKGPGCTVPWTTYPYAIPSPYGSLWTTGDEWGFTGSWDQEVKNDGGNKVWRISNAVTSSGFSNQPYSPSSLLVAGATGAALYNDRGPSHTTPVAPPGARYTASSKYFHGGFKFKSATGAAQPGLTMAINPAPRQGNVRMSFVGITDNGSTGFNLNFFQTNTGGTFSSSIPIATDLSYTSWHELNIYIEFVNGLNGDGSGNDIVIVELNGSVIHVGTTWETYYASPSWTSTPSPIAVDALMFRLSGTAVPANSGNGFYVDDVEYDNVTPPAIPARARVYADGAETMLLSSHFFIQDAINAASNGNFIRVDAGTYDEVVTVNKSLTLRGANQGIAGNAVRGAESILDGNNGTHPGFVVTSNNVTIDGFKVQNCGAGLYESGIYINSSGCTIKNNILFNNAKGLYPSNTGTTTVEYNLFDANNRPGPGGAVAIYAFTTNSLSVLNNEFKGQTSNSVAIFDGGASHINLVFNNNYLHDNDPGSSAIYAAKINGGEFGYNHITNGRRGIKLAGGNSNINIHNNTISGTVQADVMLSNDGFGANSAIEIHDNSLTSAVSILNDDIAIPDATCNSYGTLTPAAKITGTGSVNYCPWLTVFADDSPSQGFQPVENSCNGTGGPGGVVTNTNTGNLYCSIQAAINAASTNDIISVGSGTYIEDVLVNKLVTLTGAGAATTTVSGPIGGDGATFTVSAAGSGSIIEGFTITREGNNLTDWNNGSLNSAGVSIQGQTVNAIIRNNTLTGNRTGIDINNSNGNTIYRNNITFNRTGLIFRNQTDNTSMTENFVIDNWTAGVLFLDASGGTNSPVQTAASSNFNNNNISSNWYGDIVDRQVGGALPAPGTNLKNFECNWFGDTSPSVSTLNSAEPGYAAQIPVLYGGAATNPGGAPNILGPASANFDFVSWLVDGTDDEFGTNGFQPVDGECIGTPVVITSATSTPNQYCQSDGSITVNYSGGTANYTVSWSGAASGSTMPPLNQTGPNTLITGLPNGAYVVTVTDMNGSTASTMLSVSNLPVRNTTITSYYATIQAAINAAASGNILDLCAGTYNENVVVDKALTIQGSNSNRALQILDGTGIAAGSNGFTINSNITGVTIKNFTIQNFIGTGGNSAGIKGVMSNSNLLIDNVDVKNNVNSAGIHLAAISGINNVTITNSSSSNHGPGARGIVIWDGLKTNINISNNTVTNNNCCGIELQDGDASAVTISGNTISIGNGDNALGLTGLNNSVGPNMITNNTITGGGRYGIEIKNPNGGVTVSGNMVDMSATNLLSLPNLNKDRAGIAVFRRGVLYNNIDVPTGVTITGNTVTGVQQGSDSEGFGIVIEGTNHSVTGNMVSGCDVGIQQQRNPSNYPGIADDSDVADQYFGRGNSPITCGNVVIPNDFTGGNGINYRSVGALAGDGFVSNPTSGETFCSINTAIADAQTLDSHTLNVSAGTFNENVTLTKDLTINGAGPAMTIISQDAACVPSPATIGISISANNATVQNLKVTNFTNGLAVSSTGVLINNVESVSNCNTGLELSSGTTNLSVQNSKLNNNTSSGFRKGTAATVTGFILNNSEVKGNVFGCFVSKNNGAGGTFDNVTITNSDFSNNTQKGMYFEALSNARIDGVTMNASGIDPAYNNNAGIDINLKYANYANDTIQNCDITNSGVYGTATDAEQTAAMMIKARNDGVTYGPNPATLSGVIVKNNRITGPQNGIRFGEFGVVNTGPSNVTLEGNDLSHAFANKAVIRRTNNSINLVCNWHGTTILPIIWGTFSQVGSGSINLNNVLGVGTDGNPAVGFQPSGSCTCPSGNLVTNTNTSETFCTIQAAIDDADTQNYHVLVAGPGTYIENIVVNKELDIRGANYNVNPNTGSRGPESILMTAIIEVGGSNNSRIVAVDANNVKINGFLLDGNNPALTSGFTNNVGADMDIRNGIDNAKGIQNLRVENNIIKNMVYYGVRIQSTTGLSPAVSSGHEIHNNRFMDMGTYQTVPSGWGLFGGGVLLQNSHYAKITNNLMLNVRIGVQLGNFQAANPNGLFVHTIDNNQIQARRIGIFYNLLRYSPWTVSNNEITGLSSTDEGTIGGSWRGLRVTSVGLAGMGTSTFTNNDVDGSAISNINKEGINVWNVTDNSRPIFNGGTITGVNTGAMLMNHDASNGNAADGAHATLTNVNISATGVGVHLLDSPSSTTHANVQATATNNFIVGGAEGVKLEEAAGGTVTGTVNNNSIIGQSGFAIDATTITNIVAGTCNWYGSKCAIDVAAKISGLVTFNPFLVSGVDDDSNPANGFQPQALACESLDPLLASITGIITLCEAGPTATSDLTGSAVGGKGVKTFSWTNTNPSVVELSSYTIPNPTVSTVSPYPAGTSTLTLTVTDEYGCTDTESVIYTVTNPAEAPTYTIGNSGADITGNFCNTTLNLTTDPTNCGATRSILKPVWMDNCSAVTATITGMPYIDNGAFIEVFFPKGNGSVVNFIGQDIYNNTTTCTLTVNVTDDDAPVFSNVPANVTINVQSGNCIQVITWTPPTVFENCPGVVVTSNYSPGAMINAVPGVSTQVITVTYTATDAAAIPNVSTVSFTITLNFNCIPAVELSMQMPTFTPALQAVATGGMINGVYTVKNLSTTNATHELTPQGNVKVLVALPSSNIFSTSDAELNTDWDITYYPALPTVPTGMLLFTLKTGISIPPLGSKTIILKYTATGTTGQTARTTGNLIKGSGGDVDKNNNNTLGNFSIN